VNFTDHVAGVAKAKLRYEPQFSSELSSRYTFLAAISLAFSRPLLAAALALEDDYWVHSRLRAAMPYRKRIFDRVDRISEKLRRSRSQAKEKPVIKRVKKRPILQRKPGPEYLAATTQAILELGAEANQRKIRQRAEVILESNRLRPVDKS